MRPGKRTERQGAREGLEADAIFLKLHRYSGSKYVHTGEYVHLIRR